MMGMSESINSFKVGDVVTLMSSRVKMTVAKICTDGDLVCVYDQYNSQVSMLVTSAAVLKLVRPDLPTPSNPTNVPPTPPSPTA